MTNHILARPHEAAGLQSGTVTLVVRPVVARMTAPKIAPLDMEPWLIDGVQETDDDGRPCWIGRHPDYPYDKWFSPEYGVGQRVAVREKCAIGINDDCDLVCDYHADGKRGYFETDTPEKIRAADWYINDGQRSAAQMPLWAVRTYLTVTSVSCVRLHSLSHIHIEHTGFPNPCGYYCDISVGHVDHQGTINKYAEQWDQTYGRGAWEQNPWVWCWGVEKS